MTVLRAYFDRASFLALGIFVAYLLAPVYLTPPLVLFQLGIAGRAPQPSDLVSETQSALVVPAGVAGRALSHLTQPS